MARLRKRAPRQYMKTTVARNCSKMSKNTPKTSSLQNIQFGEFRGNPCCRCVHDVILTHRKVLLGILNWVAKVGLNVRCTGRKIPKTREKTPHNVLSWFEI